MRRSTKEAHKTNRTQEMSRALDRIPIPKEVTAPARFRSFTASEYRCLACNGEFSFMASIGLPHAPEFCPMCGRPRATEN
jgi:hypothetical protein